MRKVLNNANSKKLRISRALIAQKVPATFPFPTVTGNMTISSFLMHVYYNNK